MTQKQLIDYCNTYNGLCEDCPHEETCYRYQDKHGGVPAFDDTVHPGRYTDEEI